MLKNLFKFIFSRVFVVNVAILMVMLALFVGFTIYYLDSYTHHGEQITVRSLEGSTLDEVEELLASNKLNYVVNDTGYTADFPPGAVISQNPKAGALVKENRTIYLTINDVEPPKVGLPDLKYKSIRVATSILKTKDVRVGKIDYRPSSEVSGNDNYILQVLVEGDTLAPGDMIHRGSTVDLIVSSGMDGGNTVAPTLIGLTLQEAMVALIPNNLNLGSVVVAPDVELGDTYEDTLAAVIYKQIPDPETPYQVGAPVDVFIIDVLPDSLMHYLYPDSLFEDGLDTIPLTDDTP